MFDAMQIGIQIGKKWKWNSVLLAIPYYTIFVTEL